MPTVAAIYRNSQYIHFPYQTYFAQGNREKKKGNLAHAKPKAEERGGEEEREKREGRLSLGPSPPNSPLCSVRSQRFQNRGGGERGGGERIALRMEEECDTNNSKKN